MKNILFLSLINILISLPSDIIWNKTLESYQKMFYKLSNITRIYLSNLEENSIKNMSYMFSGCSSLEYIKFNSIDTSSIEDMRYLFSNCYKLTQMINFYNIKTENTKYMDYMFYNCTDLSSLELNIFKTEKLRCFLIIYFN